MKIAQITYSGFGGLGSVVFSLIFADEGNNNDWIIGFPLYSHLKSCWSLGYIRGETRLRVKSAHVLDPREGRHV